MTAQPSPLKITTIVCFQLCFVISHGRRIDSSFQQPEIHPSISGQNDIQTSQRNPRFFLGTTTTSTTVLSTTTACYVSAAAITTACTKKKRSIEDLPIIGISVSDSSQILPSSSRTNPTKMRQPKSLNLKDIKDLNQIANVKVGTRGRSRVEPRFFGYFYTSTVTTTSTSFTATTTFTIANCTPAGSFAYAVCG